MSYSQPARTAPRRVRIRRLRAACVLVAIAASAAVVGYQSLASSSATDVPVIDVIRGGHPRAIGEPRSALGEAGGAVPDGTTVFADGVSGVANLDPDLRAALRQAANDAAAQGVRFVVDSGWRSAEYQEHLLQQAIAKYGSREEAARWVASPDRSAHVSGDAVDIGHSDAAAWLSQQGAAYGLCRIYGNEPWHFELRPEAVDRGCPPTYADPTHDPRMQP